MRRRVAAITGFIPLLIPLTASAGGHGGGSVAGVGGWQTVLTAPGGINPTSLAIDTRGNPRLQKWAYTVDVGSGRIVKLGTGGNLLGSWAYSSPQGQGLGTALAVDRVGNVLVADAASGQVARYSPSGAILTIWKGFDEPNGVATDAAGNVYVTERKTQQLIKMSESGGRVSWRIDIHCGTSAYPATPIGVAVAADPVLSTTIYVAATCPAAADLGPRKEVEDEVIAYNAAGIYQNAWIGESAHGGFSKEQEQWVQIHAVATDRWGNWYVAGLIRPLGAQKTAEGVFRYYPHAYERNYWFVPATGNGGTTAVAGMAVDGMGRVYVTQGHRILRHPV